MFNESDANVSELNFADIINNGTFDEIINLYNF